MRAFLGRPLDVVAVVKKRFYSLPVGDRWRCSAIVVLLYVSSAMMFFGMNFFLWSFQEGLNTFVSMFIPAVLWAVMFLASLLLYRRLSHRDTGVPLSALTTTVPRKEEKEDTVGPIQDGESPTETRTLLVFPSSASRTRFVLLLLAMGLIDSLGGLTAVYATTRVPMLLQSLLIAGGPMYTYAFSRLFFPSNVHKVTLSFVVSALCLAGGIVVSLLPEIDSSGDQFSVAPEWLAVYVASAMLPAMLNVVQGRFMRDYDSSFSSRVECKLVALCGDTVSQVFFTALYFPLDAVPGFGATESLSLSWEGFINGSRCIFFHCSNNFLYFAIYVMGMWLNRVAFTYMNHYSPTVGAVVSELTQPINTLLMLIFPRLNIFGQPGSWWCSFLCFALLSLSMVLLVAWHEGQSQAEVDQSPETVANEDES